METSSPLEPPVTSVGSPHAPAEKGEARSVRHCNFRPASPASKEVQRALADLHEALAHNLQCALGSYLNAEIAIKFKEFTNGTIRGYLEDVPSLSYLSIVLTGGAPYTMVLEATDNFSSLVLNVLLGGKTDNVAVGSPLSEIEEELMLDVTSVILRETEKTWDLSAMSMESCGRVEPSALIPHFRAGQGLVVAAFEVRVSGVACQLKLVVPAASMGMRARTMQCKSTSRGRLAALKESLSERIRDCEVSLSAELAEVKISVEDLMVLRSGAILKLLVPVDTPISLMLADRQIFEAAIVKNQDHRAAHVGQRT